MFEHWKVPSHTGSGDTLSKNFRQLRKNNNSKQNSRNVRIRTLAPYVALGLELGVVDGKLADLSLSFLFLFLSLSLS